LAVQSAVIPLLLPGAKAYNGDICISAPTGSGKTLAYMLPMVESLKQKITSRLRGLIVVPTRELVVQARQVAAMCAAGTGLQIGTAVGNVSLSEEQERLIKRGQRYDPAAFKIMYDEACKRVNVDFGEDEELQHDFLTLLLDHVPEFSSKVDILICTPGRLVDHIRNSRGFSLSEVDWLVIDEADRLLDESFQEWVATLLDALHPKISDEQKTAREKVLASMRPSQGERRVKKIIMSATMTRDLSKLATLRLRRPTLVAVVDDASSNDKDAAETSAYTFELPPMLEEKVIHVGDGKEKPLCLWQLIQGHVLRRDPDKNVYDPCNITIRGQKLLVFARDNENASRLAYIIKTLLGTQAQTVGLLTKSSTKSKETRKALKSFQLGQIQILIATDRASRGIDFEIVAHVINYDVPHNIAGYIHRVGRTARAGNKGTAWTLVTDIDAGWFLSEIAKSDRIRRGGRAAERMKVDMKSVSEETRLAYRTALDGLMDAVATNYTKNSKVKS
jgi:ATP-dependent RNA helicase DDX51/DBP6